MSLSKNLILSLCFLTLLTSCVEPPPPEAPPLPLQMADTSLAGGVAAFQSGEYRAARLQFLDALAIYRSIDNPMGKLHAYLNLTETALATHDLQPARAALAQARDLIEKEKIAGMQARLHLLASSLAVREDNFAKAKEILAPYVTDPFAGNLPAKPVYILTALQSRTYIAFAEANETEKWVNTLARFMHEKKMKNMQSQARLNRFYAQLALEAGKPSESDMFFSKALATYRVKTSRPAIAATLKEWGKALLEQKRYDEANDRLERALAVRVSMQDIVGGGEILQLLLQGDEATGNAARIELSKKWLAISKRPFSRLWDKYLQQRIDLANPFDPTP